MSLIVNNLSFAYGKAPVLKNISLPELAAGKLTVLLGPNAAGKTTLFKSIAGMLPANVEDIQLAGKALHCMGNAERFRLACYMPQTFSGNAALTVFEVILLARKQLVGWRVNHDDTATVEQLLRRLNIEHLAEKYIGELSGGQQQLVSLCQTLARDASLFMLDEPTSALDLKRQLEVLELLKQEARSRKVVSIIALHDLSLAARFADQVIVMKDGQIKAHGETEQVFASGVIEETYDVDVELMRCQKGSLVLSASL